MNSTYLKDKKVDALIFDMDGTLWDGVEAYAQGFNDYFEANHIDRHLNKNDIKQFMGLEEEQFLKVTLKELDSSERKVAYQHVVECQYKRIQKDGGVLYDGVKEGLEKLAKTYKLFIVSNCPEFTIDYFTAWAQIDHLISDSIAHGSNYKAKFENINSLVKKHGL